MSVDREAHERVDKAREHIQQAIEELSAVVITRCPGWDEFNSEAMREHEATLPLLMQARKNLDR